MEESRRLFLREANERIRLVNASFVVMDGSVELFCECGASGCIQRIEIAASAYDHARGDKQLFIVRPGHERLGRERVEGHEQTYLVVRSHRTARRMPDPAPVFGSVQALDSAGPPRTRRTLAAGPEAHNPAVAG
jgi:hypothetical protein